MTKKVIRSSSNVEKALDQGVSPYWFSVLHSDDQNSNPYERNPWNQDMSELEKPMYLADDCVIVIRPARQALKENGAADYEKDRYFFEISNQDSTVIFSSYKTYAWDDVHNLAFVFKSLSFPAATRVWKSKKL